MGLRVVGLSATFMVVTMAKDDAAKEAFQERIRLACEQAYLEAAASARLWELIPSVLTTIVVWGLAALLHYIFGVRLEYVFVPSVILSAYFMVVGWWNYKNVKMGFFVRFALARALSDIQASIDTRIERLESEINELRRSSR